MTDIVGGSVPVPARRPTAVGSSVNTDETGPPVPSRPAPAVPGHRPTPPVHSRQADETPMSMPPPPPSRPLLAIPTRPPDKATPVSAGSVRRRPEITIVSARPMSEVGFRAGGESTPPTTKGPEGVDQANPLTKPARPEAPSPKNVPSTSKGPVPSNKQDVDLLINFDDECSDNVAVTRPILPKVLPSSGPPPIPGRPSVTSPDFKTSVVSPDTSRGPPPPVPKHPPLSPNGPSDESPPRPLGAPPPVPRHLPPSPKPPNVPPPRPLPDIPLGRQNPRPDSPTNTHTADIDNVTNSPENTNDTTRKDSDSKEPIDSTDAMYAVINKPKRPTIIRPGKSHMASDGSESRKMAVYQNETEVKKPITSTTNPEIPRRAYDDNKVSTNTDLSSNKTIKDLPVNKSNGNSVPEFLKLKLKATVVEGDTATDSVGTTSDSVGRVPTENKPSDTLPATKAPPPAMKPKPKLAVKPKPQIAAKPAVAPKMTSDTGGGYVKNIGSFLMQKEESNTDEKVGESTRGQRTDSKINIKEMFESLNKHADESKDVDTDTGKETVKPIKPIGFKRPTIIRAGRNVQSENDDTSEDTVTDAKFNINQNISTESLDDTALRKRSPNQPPLPSKRPMSMVNIPSQVRQEETTQISSSRSMDIATEMANMRPSAVPRPAARGRPASVAVPNMRPPPPSSQRKSDLETHETSSHPTRPQHRPSVRFSPPTSSTVERNSGSPESDEKQLSEISEPRVTHRPKIIGVSVLPMVNKKGDSVFEKGDNLSSERSPMEEDTKPPAKPGRRPPPPLMPSQQEEGSSEEEFMSALDKPSRPAPPRAKASPESKEERPIRPSGPPAPRKTSLDMPREATESGLVKMRPSRPEGKPSRPMSMPVKIEETAHGKPPRPTTAKAKSKGTHNLPPRPGPGHPLYHYMMQVPHGIALYDYTASQDDELTFQEGDVITFVRAPDEEWIIGRLGESEGMFPRGFVKVKMPLPGETLEDDDSSESEPEMYFDATAEKPDTLGYGPRCRARFDFEGQGREDLTFDEGDVFRLVERVGLEWCKGEINGHIGLFPLSFVEVIEDLPPDGSTENTSRVVTALFDFDGEPNELNFSKGQIITVQYRVDEEWLYGESGGQEGQFPIQFIDHVPPDLPTYPHNKAPESPVMARADPLSQAMSAWGNDGLPVNDGLPAPGQQRQTKSPDKDTSYCIALFDFTGETDTDLSFVAGDRIELLERVGADWLRGRTHNRTGMFPTGFVEIHDANADVNTGSGTPDMHSTPTIYGLAQHDFAAAADNELTLQAGDRLELLEMVEGAEDWQWGRLNGRKGIFPAAFVTVES